MTLGVALIGVGMVSEKYAQAVADIPGLHWAGALGARAGSGAAFLERNGITARAYGSVAELAADPDVGLVFLATPPNARAAILSALAAAGKPVLMEKPIERTVSAAAELVALCEVKGVPLGIMLQHRARPVVQELQARVGEMGALHLAEISVPWWRPQSYYDEPGRGTYERDGGGVMISQAIHPLDLALQFTGPVVDVIALTATSGLHRMESEDVVSAGMRFANGAVGSFFASTACFPGRGDEIVLQYDRASVRLETGTLRIDWHDGRSEDFGATEASGGGADPMAFRSDLFRTMIEDFADSLTSGRAPIASGQSAMHVHRVIAATERSGRSGMREQVGDVAA